MKARIAAVAIISTVSSVIVPVAAHAADGCTQPVEVAAETLQQAINQVSNPLSVREDAAKRGLTSLTDEEKQLRALLQETQNLIHVPGNTCKYVDDSLLEQIDGLINNINAANEKALNSVDLLRSARAEATAAIDAMEYLTDEQEVAAKKAVSDAKTQADINSAVANAQSQNDVTSAKWEEYQQLRDTLRSEVQAYVKYIESLDPADQPAARAVVKGSWTVYASSTKVTNWRVAGLPDSIQGLRDAIEQLLKGKKDAAKETIDGLGNLSDADKEGFKAQVDDATTSDAVESVVTAAEAKDAANKAAALAAAKSDLEKAIAAAEAVKASDSYTYDDAVDKAALDKALEDADAARNSNDKDVVDAAKAGLDAAIKAINGVAPVTPSTGSEGTGSEGSNPGTGSEGTGSEGSEGEGTGSEGTGSEGEGAGTGSEGAGSEGSNPGTGSEGTGSEGEGAGTGSEGAGSEGSNPGTGSEGTGSEGEGAGTVTPSTGSEGTGSEGSNPGTGSEGSNPGSGSEGEGTGSEGEGAGTVIPGTDAEDAALEAAKEAAKEAANDTIDGLPNLSDTEKEGFKAQVEAATTPENVKTVVDAAKAQDAANKAAADAAAALDAAKSDLEKAIAAAEVVKASDAYAYDTAADQAGLDEALAAAKDALSSNDKAVVDAAKAGLDAATKVIDGVAPATANPGAGATNTDGNAGGGAQQGGENAAAAQADKDALNSAIEDAKGVKDSDSYKNASDDKKAAFDAALAEAVKVYGDSSATSTQVKDVTTKLIEAQKALDGTTITAEAPAENGSSWWKWLLALIPAVLGLIGIGSYVVYVNQVDGGDRAPLQRGQANPADYIRWIQNLPARTDGGL